jgi:hypothetical protein
VLFRERGQPDRRSKHRAPGAQRSDDVPDRELDTYLAALSPAADVGPSELTGRFGSAEVFQLRLPALRIEQLRRFAAERGVAPATLAVDWVIERLDAEDPETGPVPVLPPPQSVDRDLRQPAVDPRHRR